MYRLDDVLFVLTGDRQYPFGRGLAGVGSAVSSSPVSTYEAFDNVITFSFTSYKHRKIATAHTFATSLLAVHAQSIYDAAELRNNADRARFILYAQGRAADEEIASDGAACKTLSDSGRRKTTQVSNDIRARQLARF